MVVRGAHVWSVLIAFIVHVLSGILLYLSQSLNAYYYRSCQQYDGVKVANANCESANIIESKENEHVAAVLRAKSRIAAHRITSTHA